MKKATPITIIILVGLLVISILIAAGFAGRVDRARAAEKTAELAFDSYLENTIAGRLTEWEGRIKVFIGESQQRGGFAYGKETDALFAQFDQVRKSLADLKKKTGPGWLAQKDKTIALFNAAETNYNRLRDQIKW